MSTGMVRGRQSLTQRFRNGERIVTAKIKIYPTTKAIVSFAKRTQAKMTAALEKAYRKMYPDKSDAEIAAVVEETIRESEPSEAEMAPNTAPREGRGISGPSDLGALLAQDQIPRSGAPKRG